MLKVLVIVAGVVLGLTVYVAVQNQRAAEQAINKTAQTPKAAVPSLDHEKPQENAENSQWNSPSWYGFFAWPNSTTTWAILLTLWAVAWQSHETKKAAGAALLNAKVAAGSAVPTLMLHRFQFIRGPEVRDDRTFLRHPKVEITVRNFGQSPAFLKAWTFRFVWEELPDKPVYDFPYPCDVEEVIEPRDKYTLDPETTEATSPTPEAIIDAVIAGKKHLTVYGFVSYGDIFSSPIRYMKFSKRLYDFDIRRNYFSVMDHGGYEYTGQHEHYDAPNQKWPKPT